MMRSPLLLAVLLAVPALAPAQDAAKKRLESSPRHHEWVQIKHGSRITGAALSGLRSFAAAHPGVPRVVVCQAPEPFRIEEVEVLPYRTFFERLAEWI